MFCCIEHCCLRMYSAAHLLCCPLHSSPLLSSLNTHKNHTLGGKSKINIAQQGPISGILLLYVHLRT